MASFIVIPAVVGVVIVIAVLLVISIPVAGYVIHKKHKKNKTSNID